MKLSIIGGTGPQGKGLALRFAKVGFEVALGSRDKARAVEVANSLSSDNPNLVGQITGLSNSQAIAYAEKFVIFSVPWKGHNDTLNEVKEMLADQNDVKLEIQGVYGVYDIIVKLSSDNSEKLKSIVTNDIRKIENVQS